MIENAVIRHVPARCTASPSCEDNIDVRGMPATAGSPALSDAGDRGDAFLVRRLREAGAVILGKANLSEWANFRSYRSTSGWSTLGGQAANPHALDRNPSGSSSGSGAAVATPDCPARGHRVQGGPPGRRVRSAPPTLDPVTTHPGFGAYEGDEKQE